MNLLKNDWVWMKGHLTWLKDSKEHLGLTLMREEFNDVDQMRIWQNLGHNPRTGAMYDMRHANQPALTQNLIAYFEEQDFEHVVVSYYRMDPGDNLPYHRDLYIKYLSLFNLENRKQNIVRFILFPEDRKPGHIFEVDGKLFDWKSGDWVAWRYDALHLAANIGDTPRYTIQVTGVIREDI